MGSGTVGLFLALRSVGVIGKKVIIPALTCPSVANAVFAAGGIPLAVDVSYDDYNMDPASLKSAAGTDTKAVIVVDSFGYPADIHGIREIVDGLDCPVIEDACQAYGGMSEGEVLGTRGDIGVISFGYSKPLDIGGGGFVFVNSDKLSEKIERMRGAWDFDLLKNVKNGLAIRLMLKNRFDVLRFLSAGLGLLRYNFPEIKADTFHGAWNGFLSEIDDLRSGSVELHKHITAFPGVEAFDYKGEDWLPWRYSFKIPDMDKQKRILNAFKGKNIKTTALYRPVTDYFKDIETAGPLTNAMRLKDITFNFQHGTKIKELEYLIKALADKSE